MKTYAIKSSANRTAKKIGGKAVVQKLPDNTWAVFKNREEKDLYELYGVTNCPHCAVGLDNGVVSDADLKADNQPGLKAFLYSCLGCGAEFGPALTKLDKKGPTGTHQINHNSTAANPCNTVWEIAEKLKGQKRKEVIGACVEAGVAYNTARTQYQKWFQASKNDSKNG